MTLPRLYEIMEYWQIAPPLDESFAAFLRGFGETKAVRATGRPVAPPPDAPDSQFVQDLLAAGFQLAPGVL